MYTLFFLLYSLTFAGHSDEGSGMCPHGGHGATMYAGLGIDPNG